MKKAIIMLLLALLILTIFSACSPNGESEAELRVKIRAELEAEMEANENREPTGSSARVEAGKLSRFAGESINGVQINYSDCYSVIIPMYYGANIAALESVSKIIGSPSGSYQTMNLNFAVFGELKDVIVTYSGGKDLVDIPTELGTFSNANVSLEVYAPNDDATHLEVTGKAYIGQGNYRNIRFALDDMRDSTDYKVIMFK